MAIVPKYRKKVFYGRLHGEVGKIIRQVCCQKEVLYRSVNNLLQDSIVFLKGGPEIARRCSAITLSSPLFAGAGPDISFYRKRRWQKRRGIPCSASLFCSYTESVRGQAICRTAPRYCRCRSRDHTPSCSGSSPPSRRLCRGNRSMHRD
ncbi:hypothetical protein F6V25_15485 [Oryzomonas japonica]|uniref:Uncharacterized protein n=1 Tax=Oryzomonas japonica TaxID=2603858 RepID=A0A7J4ZMF5_9BACT|nr:hypothetical protein F6V25_15485 [Oryzomonas japonica]